MELIKTKQSQLNKVADFALNPRPSSHTKGLLDYELLLAGEKKKSVALMHITQDNKFVRIVEEFQEKVYYLKTRFNLNLSATYKILLKKLTFSAPSLSYLTCPNLSFVSVTMV